MTSKKGQHLISLLLILIFLSCGEEDDKAPKLSIGLTVEKAITNGDVQLQATLGPESDKSELVEFLFDSTVIESMNAAPFQTTWSTTGVAEATYTIRVRATRGSSSVESKAASIRVDRTSPKFVSQVPTLGSEISRTQAIELTFSEPLERTSLSATSIVVQSDSQENIPIDFELDVGGTVLTLTLVAVPKSASGVTVSLTEMITDLASNGLEPEQLTFMLPPWSLLGNSLNLENVSGAGVRMVVLSDGTPVVAFGQGAGASSTLALSKWDGTAWSSIGTPLAIESQSDGFGLAIDDSDTIWVARKSDGGVLVQSIGLEGALDSMPLIALPPSSYAPALALSPSGQPFVAVASKGNLCSTIDIYQWEEGQWGVLNSPLLVDECNDGPIAIATTLIYDVAILYSQDSKPFVKRWNGNSWKSVGSGSIIDANGTSGTPFPSENSVFAEPRLIHQTQDTLTAAWEQRGKVVSSSWNGATWNRLGRGQLNARPSRAGATLVDASANGSGDTVIGFVDRTAAGIVPEVERPLITLWKDGRWNFANLKESSLQDGTGQIEGVAIDDSAGMFIAYLDQELKLRVGYQLPITELVEVPERVNDVICGSFIGDPDDPASDFPKTLGETGCYSDVPSRTVIPAAIPYIINSKLWTDGAQKKRYVVLPGLDSKMVYHDLDAWELPVGTIIIKEFLVQSVVGDPNSDFFPVETRFLIRRTEADWGGYSYIWNEAGTEATLRPNESETVAYSIQDPNNPSNTTFEQFYPSRDQCFSCHGFQGWRIPLGLNTAQLNRKVTVNGQVTNQLELFRAMGLVDEFPETPAAELVEQANPYDSTRTVSDRARSYLHSNCAHCHNSVPGLCGDWRYGTDLADAGICSQISPGDPLNSMVYKRVVERAPIGPMPQLGTYVTDPLITDLLYRWIEELDSCQ